MVAKLSHRIAITVWIMLISYLIISDFLGFEKHIISSKIINKHLILIPFFSFDLPLFVLEI